MKTIRTLTIILGLIIAASLIWAAILPSSVNIKKTVEIDAPVSKVFPQVNNLKNWTYWSQWTDSLFHTKYEGESIGVGAKMFWTDETEGRAVLSITESIDNELINTHLQFEEDGKPAITKIAFTETPTGTEVSWEMTREDLSFPFGRFVGLIIEKGAGNNFQKSLDKLKQHCESIKDQPDYLGYKINDEIKKEQHFIAFVDSGNQEVLADKFKNGFKTVLQKVIELGKDPATYTVAEWRAYDPTASSTFACLAPIAGRLEIEDDKLSYYSIPEQRTLWLTHNGSYESSFYAWNTLDKYVEANKLQTIGDPYEVYVVAQLVKLILLNGLQIYVFQLLNKIKHTILIYK